MKTFTKTIVIAALTFSSIGFASATTEFVPADDYVTTKLCLVASQGNKAKLSRTIKDSGLSKRYVAQNVKCNEQNIVAFVEQYGNDAENINNFLTSGKYGDDMMLNKLAAR